MSKQVGLFTFLIEITTQQVNRVKVCKTIPESNFAKVQSSGLFGWKPEQLTRQICHRVRGNYLIAFHFFIENAYDF